MIVLKSVQAARACLRERPPPCDNCDFATLAAESVAMSQLSQPPPRAGARSAVAMSQLSRGGGVFDTIPDWPPSWRARFDADTGQKPEGVRRDEWQSIVRDAKGFGGGHAVRLAALGWGFVELFAVPAHWGRLDRRGAAFFVRARPVIDITVDAIVFQADARNCLTVRRRPALQRAP